jgi:ParB/RepB/Spo0J family partition protein
VSTPTPARRAQDIALDQIEVGGNVRELDIEHVTAQAGSMAVRGLIVPVAVRPLDGDRFALVAGEHRLAAARELGWSSIAAVITDQADGASGDQGAENVLRKTLTPLEEARAVERMLADGYTVDGAATVLGWHKRRVTARSRILELPETAQTLVGTGEIPVAGIDAMLEIQAVSPKLVALVAEVIAEAAVEGNQLGAQLARDPGWLVRQVLSHRPGELFAALAGGTLYQDQIAELKLGKETSALYAEAKTLHGQLDRYAYGPPPVRIGEAEIDQARAAGVLLELDRTQVILDRAMYRELVKAAVARTVEDLRARAQERANEQRERNAANGGKRARTPREETDAEHRAQAREFTRRAHAVNLDLGAALLDRLATVDPDSMDVARFLALCGRPHRTNYADGSAMPMAPLRMRGEPVGARGRGCGEEQGATARRRAAFKRALLATSASIDAPRLTAPRRGHGAIAGEAAVGGPRPAADASRPSRARERKQSRVPQAGKCKSDAGADRASAMVGLRCERVGARIEEVALSVPRRLRAVRLRGRRRSGLAEFVR